MKQASHPKGTRIGAVGYLNSRPLTEKLSKLLPGEQVSLDLPSRVADDLANGLLDVALIPSIEYIRHPEYEVISDACVAADGPVLSVMLYSRTPLHKISHLALDAGSRSSAALVRILLAEQFGINPEIELLPLSYPVERSSADAILLIGDRALHIPKEKFCVTWDLGEEWFRQTGLPFVFACWVSRKNRCPEHVSHALNLSRDCGVESLQQIAQSHAQSLSIDSTKAYHYLRDHLSYHLGPAEQRGLKLFHDKIMAFNDFSNNMDFRQRSDCFVTGHENSPPLHEKCA